MIICFVAINVVYTWFIRGIRYKRFGYQSMNKTISIHISVSTNNSGRKITGVSLMLIHEFNFTSNILSHKTSVRYIYIRYIRMDTPFA